MDKLSKEYTDQLDAIRSGLQKASEIIDHQENVMDEAVDKLNEAITVYNGILSDAAKIVEEVTRDIESHMSSQSDKWDEENGEAYNEWRMQWADVDLTPLDLVDSPGIDDHEHVEHLTELPDAP